MDHALFEEKSSYCGRTSLATATTAMAAEETDVGIRQAHDFNGDVGSAVSLHWSMEEVQCDDDAACRRAADVVTSGTPNL